MNSWIIQKLDIILLDEQTAFRWRFPVQYDMNTRHLLCSYFAKYTTIQCLGSALYDLQLTKWTPTDSYPVLDMKNKQADTIQTGKVNKNFNPTESTNLKRKKKKKKK